MEKFDFDDFRARFDAVMQTHMAKDKELVDEYKRVTQVSSVKPSTLRLVSGTKWACQLPDAPSMGRGSRSG